MVSATHTKKLGFGDMDGGRRRHNMQRKLTLAAATFEGCVAGYGHCCAGLVALKERRFLTPKLPDIDVFGGIVFALMGGSFQQIVTASGECWKMEEATWQVHKYLSATEVFAAVQAETLVWVSASSLPLRQKLCQNAERVCRRTGACTCVGSHAALGSTLPGPRAEERLNA
ncbi:hypothetical protein e1012e08.tmp0212 [Eimeria tenella]|uniref:Uncharacterized protein n=1 Tax=Eimeria tenella TaxID=5802 RepID=C8TDK9_EIMTE|nr:hypothetical protein e1012e08.tmp0141 [Eimeria tenella]CAK51353.1 hypothetical protein e1012e08.tmp0212 [Eimeria tenella]